MEGSDLLHTFQRELMQSTEQMQALFLELEHKEGEEIIPLLQEAYRLAHSLKGASRVVGLFPIEEMAHALEDRLQELLRVVRPPTSSESSVYLGIVEAFNLAFQSFLNGEMYDPAPRLEALNALENAPAAAPVEKTSVLPEEPAEPGLPAAGTSRAYKREEQVMVASRRIDDLFRRVEEAFLIESRIRSLLTEADTMLRENLPGHLEPAWQKRAGPLKNEVSRLHFVLMQFHDTVRTFRMVSMNRLRVASQKAVRDLSHSLGKPVAFHFHGMHQMVDASLLEALVEPVLHLLRNSVDHGIEPQGTRVSLGKPPEGQVSVDATVSAGFLNLTLTDDGRGISLERIRARAMELNLISAADEAELSEADWLEFMFRPGFSTAGAVSVVSGRGIGMDIVRRRIQDLGGHLQVDTHAGIGTTFSIQVPIGLLTPRVLVVRCGDHFAALPAADIERVFRYDSTQAREVSGATMVMWEQEPVPLDMLAGHLGWPSVPSRSGHVVLLQRQGIRKAVLVDEVVSEIEQVAFPPPWNLRGIPYLAGVIVTGTGTLVPVIEARDLMQKATRQAPGEMGVVPGRRQHVLVVDDSPTILALHRSILKNAGYEVVTAEDGSEAWKALQARDIDLLLTDIEMPGMNGLELIRKVRASASRKHLPVIVISQYGSREDLRKGAGAGADRYIVKSAFDPQKLLEMIQELLME